MGDHRDAEALTAAVARSTLSLPGHGRNEALLRRCHAFPRQKIPVTFSRLGTALMRAFAWSPPLPTRHSLPPGLPEGRGRVACRGPSSRRIFDFQKALTAGTHSGTSRRGRRPLCRDQGSRELPPGSPPQIRSAAIGPDRRRWVPRARSYGSRRRHISAAYVATAPSLLFRLAGDAIAVSVKVIDVCPTRLQGQ